MFGGVWLVIVFCICFVRSCILLISFVWMWRSWFSCDWFDDVCELLFFSCDCFNFKVCCRILCCIIWMMCKFVVGGCLFDLLFVEFGLFLCWLIFDFDCELSKLSNLESKCFVCDMDVNLVLRVELFEVLVFVVSILLVICLSVRMSECGVLKDFFVVLKLFWSSFCCLVSLSNFCVVIVLLLVCLCSNLWVLVSNVIWDW